MPRPMPRRALPLAFVLTLVVAVGACQKLDRPRTDASGSAAQGATQPRGAESPAVAEPESPLMVGGDLDPILEKRELADVAFDLPDEPDLSSGFDELVVIEAEEPPPARMMPTSVAPKIGRTQFKIAQAPYQRAPIPDPTPNEIAPRLEPGLQARDLEGKALGAFPLRRTSVAAELNGPLGRTRVRQEYGNPYGEVIEAVYAFPLPAMAAVTDFVLEAGGRRIVGVVRLRAEAERIYRRARARGQTASLLTQERPNLFTQSVANVEPGGEVTVELTFFERLAYEDGFFEYVFPMVVGPRYVPGRPQAAAANGDAEEDEGDSGNGGGSPAGGVAPPTDRVPDADRITPPVLAPGEASGHRIDLTVTVDAPVPIRELVVPSHRVRVREESPTRRVVRLAAGDRVPNRDFVLRYRLAGGATELGMLAHRQGGDGYFLLSVQPPFEPEDSQVMPREITFILDVSGSMSGLPLDLARAVIDQALARLRPADRFNLVYFASGNGQLWPEARPGSAENLAAARAFLERQQGGGGTEMLAGVARALHGAHDPGALQMFVFLTDGFVGDEAEILRLIREERGAARFFAFGIGSSVNRYLIDGIGEHGGGGSEVVLPRSGEVVRAAGRLLAMIDSPVLVDLSIDWGDLPVAEVYPERLPDLYAGATLELVGRYRLAGADGERASGWRAFWGRNGEQTVRGTAVLAGRLGTRQVSYPVEVELPVAEETHAVLAPVWARHKIHDLSARLLTAGDDERPQLVAAITDVALRHHLASAYTAFVAVDESRAVGDGRPLRVLQPVELPEGVSYEGVFGEQPAGAAVEIGAWGMVLQQAAGGGIGVVHLDEGGEAARSGVQPGARLLAVDRVAVRDLGHLRSLLLQAGGPTVEVRLDPGGDVLLTAP
jgi:Ca-activated chloride channel homolog